MFILLLGSLVGAVEPIPKSSENFTQACGSFAWFLDSVSWQDAQRFIALMNGKRDDFHLQLPTEAQWEYACRVGCETAFGWGDEIAPEPANYSGNWVGANFF